MSFSAQGSPSVEYLLLKSLITQKALLAAVNLGEYLEYYKVWGFNTCLSIGISAIEGLQPELSGSK